MTDAAAVDRSPEPAGSGSSGAPKLQPTIAEVMPSIECALSGEAGPLGLPPAASAVVVVVDGLGALQLREHAAYARTLAGLMTKRGRLRTTLPSTTACALTSLTTGRRPGEHGIVGYSVFDRASQAVRNQLTDWGPGMEPERWQPMATVFERLRARGVRSVVASLPKYADSGLTRAILRGAEHAGGKRIDERVDAAVRAVREEGVTLVYLYLPELDQAGHRHGVGSPEWLRALEDVDGGIAGLLPRLPRDTGVLVTGDHGMVNVGPEGHVILEDQPGLLDGVRAVAGEPRFVHLVLAPAGVREDEHASGARAATAAARVRDALGSTATVVTRDEAISRGWFGDSVSSAARDRLGDVLIVARGSRAFYTRADDPARGMVGQHGADSDDELLVPLLRTGAFAV